MNYKKFQLQNTLNNTSFTKNGFLIILLTCRFFIAQELVSFNLEFHDYFIIRNYYELLISSL